VLNFPEGTTTSGRMLRFQRGMFGVARIADVPVVPVALSFERRELAWVNDEMLLPHYARTLRAGPCIVRVKVGGAMNPHEFATPDDMARAARAWIHGHLERVWPDLAVQGSPHISAVVARKLARAPLVRAPRH
jgi:1-acyl-sn-glycerol-3-phosphate acyltransferase